jgi:uncharacterized protein YyaL (SSP411 family)
MTHSEKKSNRLINEKSPYLLQHSYNPVEWYPWTDEAFQKAKAEDKPIFLSIGYSTCHWCHVMEKESFENEEIADLMNDLFVSIKVDREERPDIDNIYMLICQLFTGSGGWPLSIIMTPDKKPFFAGTYFPPESRYGKIGLKDLLLNTKVAWDQKRNEINNSIEQITEYLKQFNSPSSTTELNIEILDRAFNEYQKRYDQKHGGFGNAPKFPSPHNLMFLLRYWKRTQNQNALDMVTHTLLEMNKGGIFDHVGFGYHRYSTDSEWLVPHFEKMLYDQALLIIIYTEAYLATHNQEFKSISEKIIEYVLRDMLSPQGGFYSAEDADSESVEGKFYLWSKSELYEFMEEKDVEFISMVYNITDEGNFAIEFSGDLDKVNIPYRSKDFDELSKYFGITKEEFVNRLEKIRIELFLRRKLRVHPLKDDKILCDWNGLMIAALSIAGRAFSNKSFITTAEKAAAFIKNTLNDNSGKLLHRYRDGSAGLQANLDDYAFLIWGLLELYQATFMKKYIDEAVTYSNFVLKHFNDYENGGFYFSPDYGEKLPARNKEFYDGAIPSGNSVMLLNLIKLYRITSNSIYEDAAKNIIKSFSSSISKAPTGSGFTLTSLEYLFGNSAELIIVCNSYDEEVDEIFSLLNSYFNPNVSIIFLNETNEAQQLSFEYLSGYNSSNNKPTFYLCRNFACNLPTHDLNNLLTNLTATT